MHKQYGPIFGMWMGPERTVVVSDYDLIVEMGAREEFSDRPSSVFVAEAGKFFIN